jgi:hypothetical protein
VKKQTPKARCWRDLISLKPRFQRSVHLERDAHEGEWVGGYLVSPAVRAVIDRVASGLDVSSARAWSLSGPYGVGKSSLALFTSHALGTGRDAGSDQALEALRLVDRELAARVDQVRGLVAVRATGERRRLDIILLSALKAALEEHWSGRGRKPAAMLAELEDALTKAEETRRVSTRQVVALFEAAAAQIASSKVSARGLFVILDEAGKVLEHAAQYPQDGDMHLLQELAEAAARSGAKPLVFMVVLHQGFEQYASRLTRDQQNEWSKVQGRFEQLPFQEAPDQIVRLIGQAFQSNPLPSAWKSSLSTITDETVGLLHFDAKRARALREGLLNTVPLHPVTALALGPLFRSGIAQNERSLFAFLGSSEPAGFQAFLDEEQSPDSPRLYPIDRLYDYVRSTSGSRLFSTNARHWAQAEAALARLPGSATSLEARLIRGIGVLGAVGDAQGLRASSDALCAAFVDPETSREQVQAALEALRERSIVVFRRYADAFQLWDGSDLDLDALIAMGASQGGVAGSMIRRVSRIAPPRPIVPRRHAINSGTLRFFEVRYADESILATGAARSEEADGTLYVVLASDERAESEVREELDGQAFWATKSRQERPLVVGMPSSARRLRQIAADLAAMEWVRTSTSELRDDATARRELSARIATAESLLRDELSALVSGDAGCEWWFNGRTVDIASGRQLSHRLSKLLGQTYSSAPEVHNELLNRNVLSSAAAGARRELLKAMVEKASEPQLGIEGFPPELSMYRSVLELHRLHQPKGSGAAFFAPEEGSSFVPVWEEILRLLADPGRKRTTIPDIYEALKRPPFGMREGVLPVLLLALMIERESEIALYEEGTFQPSVTVAVTERLLRTPQKFELQRVTIAGSRASLLRKLATGSTPNLVPIVRSLVRLATGLPDYARNTKRLSPTAVAVREALLRAKEPSPLLFTTLPQACGLPPVTETSETSDAATDELVGRLKGALRELSAAYPQLLTEVVRNVGDALGMPKTTRELREALGPRARRLLDAPAEPVLRSFLLRTGDADLEDDAWVVSVATLLAGKPPESWNDADVAHANLKLAGLKRGFRSLESLHIAALREPIAEDGYLMRMAVEQPGRPEAERVVVARPAEVAGVQVLASSLRKLLKLEGSRLSRDAQTVALALCARELIGEDEDPPRTVVASVAKAEA